MASVKFENPEQRGIIGEQSMACTEEVRKKSNAEEEEEEASSMDSTTRESAAPAAAAQPISSDGSDEPPLQVTLDLRAPQEETMMTPRRRGVESEVRCFC